jgi:hypothetical protein
MSKLSEQAERFMQHCASNAAGGQSIRRCQPWLYHNFRKSFVRQAAQKRADISQNLVARRCVALRQLIDQLGESGLASAALDDLGRDGIGLEHPLGRRLPCVRGCTRASPAHASRHVGQPQFHCGKPPPAAEPMTRAVNRPFRIDASGDQNSAGKYPLISRPMQISTRVGVVHDMAIFLLGCEDNTPFLNARPLSAVKQHFA